MASLDGLLQVTLWDVGGGILWVGGDDVEGDSGSLFIGEDVFCPAGENTEVKSDKSKGYYSVIIIIVRC